MAKNRFKDEEEFNEIMDFDSNSKIDVLKQKFSKLYENIKIDGKNQSQKNLIKSIKNNEITICSGHAGSGKTYIALAYALSLLRKPSNRYKEIYLVKSVTTLKNEDLGFLKGDFKEKIDPHMWSFYINMKKIISEHAFNILINDQHVKPFPLAYMRGASLDDCIIIGDEMQNVSLDNSRTLLTRIGDNSKIILLGDTNQIDMKNKKESSLSKLVNIFGDIDKIGVVEMDKNDINVRNPLISVIEEKFSNYMENNYSGDTVNDRNKGLIYG